MSKKQTNDYLTNKEIRRITPERAQQILMEKGVSISLENVALVLNWMYKLANLEIEHFKEKL